MVPSLSDFVLEAKIETTLVRDLNQTKRVRTTMGSSARYRQQKTEETWERRRELGVGTFGTVWLERCVAGKDKDAVRAVQEIKKIGNL